MGSKNCKKATANPVGKRIAQAQIAEICMLHRMGRDYAAISKLVGVSEKTQDARTAAAAAAAAAAACSDRIVRRERSICSKPSPNVALRLLPSACSAGKCSARECAAR